MNLHHVRRVSWQAGYTLLTTLILTAAATALLTATMSRTMTVEKLNDRDNAYQVANAAAEAATEKILSRMAVDFANGGEQALSNNLSAYTSTLPTTAENAFWTNFTFSDGQGNNNAIYVVRKTITPNPPYVQLLQQYPGLNAFAATYRVMANVSYKGGNYPSLIGAVQQDLQMAEIPVFQFALFYNTIMEFSDCAPFTVNGRVHCNTNIDVGTVSSSSLTFNYFVTASGTISNPPMAGFAQSSWTGGLTYNGTPTPGYGTGEPVLTLPVGTNNTPNSVREIINEPPAGELATNPLSPQRFYNKAYMVIMITNATAAAGTGTSNVTAAHASVTITIKNSMYDGSPTNIYLGTNIYSNINVLNWSNSGVSNWLSTNIVFYDQREGRTNHVTQIDIGALGTWLNNTNTNPRITNYNTKWSALIPFNGIIYVDDNRDTNSGYMNCVRLINGANITNGLYNTGLTLATQNPLYIEGMYNSPNSSFQGTTNTSVSRPCSFVCDALTILSPAWQSGNYDASSGPGFSYTLRNASDDTVNAAIIAGNVLSTDASSTGFSGGVMNLPRLLEDWSGNTLTLNTSMINLYNSVQATQQFQLPGNYYKAPTRAFTFDANFTTATGLPPGTPLVDRMIRGTWCNPPPNNVNYSWTNDFVAR